MSFFAIGGLLAGLAFAAIDFFVLLPLLERPARGHIETLEGMERAMAERRMRLLRVLFASQFIVFPVIGYIVGSMIGSGA
jgi:hypothetical protein